MRVAGSATVVTNSLRTDVKTALSPEAIEMIKRGEGPDYIGPPPPARNRRKKTAE
jgi:hypothetical protein